METNDSQFQTLSNSNGGIDFNNATLGHRRTVDVGEMPTENPTRSILWTLPLCLAMWLSIMVSGWASTIPALARNSVSHAILQSPWAMLLLAGAIYLWWFIFSDVGIFRRIAALLILAVPCLPVYFLSNDFFHEWYYFPKVKNGAVKRFTELVLPEWQTQVFEFWVGFTLICFAIWLVNPLLLNIRMFRHASNPSSDHKTRRENLKHAYYQPSDQQFEISRRRKWISLALLLVAYLVAQTLSTNRYWATLVNNDLIPILLFTAIYLYAVATIAGYWLGQWSAFIAMWFLTFPLAFPLVSEARVSLNMTEMNFYKLAFSIYILTSAASLYLLTLSRQMPRWILKPKLPSISKNPNIDPLAVPPEVVQRDPVSTQFDLGLATNQQESAGDRVKEKLGDRRRFSEFQLVVIAPIVWILLCITSYVVPVTLDIATLVNPGPNRIANSLLIADLKSFFGRDMDDQVSSPFFINRQGLKKNIYWNNWAVRKDDLQTERLKKSTLGTAIYRIKLDQLTESENSFVDILLAHSHCSKDFSVLIHTPTSNFKAIKKLTNAGYWVDCKLDGRGRAFDPSLFDDPNLVVTGIYDFQLDTETWGKALVNMTPAICYCDMPKQLPKFPEGFNIYLFECEIPPELISEMRSYPVEVEIMHSGNRVPWDGMQLLEFLTFNEKDNYTPHRITIFGVSNQKQSMPILTNRFPDLFTFHNNWQIGYSSIPILTGPEVAAQLRSFPNFTCAQFSLNGKGEVVTLRLAIHQLPNEVDFSILNSVREVTYIVQRALSRENLSLKRWSPSQCFPNAESVILSLGPNQALLEDHIDIQPYVEKIIELPKLFHLELPRSDPETLALLKESATLESVKITHNKGLKSTVVNALHECQQLRQIDIDDREQPAILSQNSGQFSNGPPHVQCPWVALLTQESWPRSGNVSIGGCCSVRFQIRPKSP